MRLPCPAARMTTDRGLGLLVLAMIEVYPQDVIEVFTGTDPELPFADTIETRFGCRRPARRCCASTPSNRGKSGIACMRCCLFHQRATEATALEGMQQVDALDLEIIRRPDRPAAGRGDSVPCNPQAPCQLLLSHQPATEPPLFVAMRARPARDSVGVAELSPQPATGFVVFPRKVTPGKSKRKRVSRPPHWPQNEAMEFTCSPDRGDAPRTNGRSRSCVGDDAPERDPQGCAQPRSAPRRWRRARDQQHQRAAKHDPGQFICGNQHHQRKRQGRSTGKRHSRRSGDQQWLRAYVR